jgi:soluble lytic murein transglycosylase-like protein
MLHTGDRSGVHCSQAEAWLRRRSRCALSALALAVACAQSAMAAGANAEEAPAPLPSVVQLAAPDTRSSVAQPPLPELPPPSVFSTPRPTGSPPSILRTSYGEGAPYRAVVMREAAAYGIPPQLVDAVMAVESSYNPATQGADGEVGLMQVMPSTASLLGFSGSLAELAVPETNIHYGVMYLAAAWRLAGQDICTATMKYRAGHGETRFSVRSVDYCTRVRAHLVAHGYPVTGIVPSPTFGQPFAAAGRGQLRLARGPVALDLNALNAQLREMTDSIAARARH